MVGRRDGFLALLAALGALLALALAAAPRAHAANEPIFDCKDVMTGQAAFNPSRKGPPPLAIGDSTMLLPIPNITAKGFDVNARGCRGFGEATNVMARAKKRGKLPHLIVIAVYSNGGIKLRNVADAVDVIGKGRRLVLVTEYNADTGEPPAPDTGVLFKAAKRFKQVSVLDWVKYSLAHHFVEPTPGAWFIGDLFHPNFTGAEEYANFLASVLSRA